MRVKRNVKSSKRFSRTKRTYSKYRRTSRSGYRVLSRRISSLSRRVAGEVCKFEMTPDKYTNQLLSPGSSVGTNYVITNQTPLSTISSGVPWIMPLNWYYIRPYSSTGTTTTKPFYNGIEQGIPVSSFTVSSRQPIYYNVIPSNPETDDNGTELQYRLKYLYINALFNASINSSENNTDGALRIVVVKDKQATGGSLTWYDEHERTNSRGVFNANRIDAQLNPASVGRFRIMYDKTLRFNTINGYKPFKYFKQLSTVVRNNRNRFDESNNKQDYAETNEQSPPVQKNAYYLMLFSDGLNFSYSADPSTPPASFHLFSRVAYYNN